MTQSRPRQPFQFTLRRLLVCITVCSAFAAVLAYFEISITELAILLSPYWIGCIILALTRRQPRAYAIYFFVIHTLAVLYVARLALFVDGVASTLFYATDFPLMRLLDRIQFTLPFEATLATLDRLFGGKIQREVAMCLTLGGAMHALGGWLIGISLRKLTATPSRLKNRGSALHKDRHAAGSPSGIPSRPRSVQ